MEYGYWAWTEPRIKRRLAIFKYLEDFSLLELGSGTGWLTDYLERYNDVVPIDPDPDSRTSYHLMFEEIYQSERSRWDGIVGVSVLHHLDEGFEQRLHNHLLPGGFILFSEPNYLNPQILIERKLRRLFSYVEKTETAFVRWKLRKRLIDAGFKDVKIAPFDFHHPLLKDTWTWINFMEKIPIIREFAGSLVISARS